LESTISLYGSGTSEGASKGWDARGRGGKKIILYHGTTYEVAKKAMKEGLKTSGDKSVRRWDEITIDLKPGAKALRYVYLTPNREEAETYAKAREEVLSHRGVGRKNYGTVLPNERAVVLQVEIPKKNAHKLSKQVIDKDVNFRHEGKIPASYITKVHELERVPSEPTTEAPVEQRHLQKWNWND